MKGVFCCTMRADTGSAPTEDINLNNIIKYENMLCRDKPIYLLYLLIFKITIIYLQHLKKLFCRRGRFHICPNHIFIFPKKDINQNPLINILIFDHFHFPGKTIQKSVGAESISAHRLFLPNNVRQSKKGPKSRFS